MFQIKRCVSFDVECVYHIHSRSYIHRRSYIPNWLKSANTGRGRYLSSLEE
jgi:hypothetical protein